MNEKISISDSTAFLFQSGHGHPSTFGVHVNTYPIAVICLGAAALIAALWLLAELLD